MDLSAFRSKCLQDPSSAPTKYGDEPLPPLPNHHHYPQNAFQELPLPPALGEFRKLPEQEQAYSSPYRGARSQTLKKRLQF